MSNPPGVSDPPSTYKQPRKQGGNYSGKYKLEEAHGVVQDGPWWGSSGLLLFLNTTVRPKYNDIPHSISNRNPLFGFLGGLTVHGDCSKTPQITRKIFESNSGTEYKRLVVIINLPGK